MKPEDLAARGVRVKNLVWGNDPDDVMDIISGPYAIEVLTSIWVIYCGKHIGQGFKKMNDAVAFANQHNEARILAALEAVASADEPDRIWVDGVGIEAINVAALAEAPEVKALIREAEVRVAAAALDIITSGAFDTSDPRIDELTELAEAAALRKGETT